MINQREFRVIGMSRSGNHAIINWIRHQAAGRVCFLNCAEPRTNPFLSARPLDHGSPYEVNYPDFCWESEQRGKFSTKDLLIFSHEDVFLGTVHSEVFERHHDQMVGASGSRLNVLILRDPFNLFASRLKGHCGQITAKTMLRIWKQHAREFLGHRSYLKHSMIGINYNHWVCSRTYRRALAAQLGLAFTDRGINDVPRCAGGSSFDGRRLHGRATAMRVLSRWREFAREKSFWKLFDADAFSLAMTIFGTEFELAEIPEANEKDAPRIGMNLGPLAC